MPVKFCGHCGKQAPDIDQNSSLLLFPFLDGDKIGYIDYHTNLVYIPPMFHEGRLFSEGLAAVRMNESPKWVFINERGDIVINGEYFDCSEFSNGLAIVEILVPLSDESDGPDGGVNYLRKRTRLGVINTFGDEVIPCEYTSIERRSNGFFVAKKGEKEFLFDKNCNLVFESEFYSIRGYLDLKSDLFGVYQKDTHLYGLIDHCGNFVLSPKYVEMKSFSDDLCPVCSYVNGQKKWGFIDTDGIECIPCQFQEVGDFHDGVVTYSELRKDLKEFNFPDGKHIHPYGYRADGLINILGKTVVEPMTYYSLYSSNEGLIECRDFNNLVGFLNSKGEVVIHCKFKEASKFINGLCVAENPEGKCGMIDKNGNTIIPFEYDSWQLYYDRDNHIRTKDNLFVLKKNGRFGVIDIDCNTIIPHQYDMITITGEGSFLVKQGEFFGLMNHQGEFVIPLGLYDRIEKIYTTLPLELYRVYKGHDLSGIVDANGSFRVPCQFFWINNSHMGSTDLLGNPFKLDHRPTCILGVRKYDEHHNAIWGKADFFGNYLFKKN